MEPAIPAVNELSSSSSEPVEAAGSSGRGRGRGRGRSSKRRRQSTPKAQPAIDDAARVQSMLSKTCRSKGTSSCRDHFRTKNGVREVIKFREQWKGLHKVDQDEAFERIRSVCQDERGGGRKQWRFLGTGRFQRLMTAVEAGERKPPADLRYLSKSAQHILNPENEELKSGVLSFLESIYSSVAETLPDVGDTITDILPEAEEPDPDDLALTGFNFGCWIQSEGQENETWSSDRSGDLAALADEQAFRLFGGFGQATTASCGSGQFRATTNALIASLAGHLAARQMQQRLLYDHQCAQFRDRCLESRPELIQNQFWRRCVEHPHDIILRQIYLTEKKHGGLIRPWQCGWRADFGISGMVDPEVAETLMELFLTDPRNVGTEQVAATDVPKEFLESEYKECRALEGHSVQLAQMATKRQVHCFNLLRQTRILSRAGISSDWDTAAGVARAFSIGRAESSALFQLLTDVSLYLQRIVSDHDSTPEPLRKALSFKEATRLHQATGCFLFMLDALQKIAPASRFGDMKTSLENQFFMKFMDGDLVHCLEERVPLSADLTMVSAFRPLKAQIEQGRVQAIEEETVRLRADVAKANFAQVKTLIERDMQTLKDKLPGAQDSARETALDMKKGRAYAAEYMQNNCFISDVGEDMETATPTFLQFMDGLRGISGSAHFVGEYVPKVLVVAMVVFEPY
ncbi:unnamed protein product [Durusdinium trenchii]|uniref:Uncharacterized protein n=1 Tax=Durusdinium trenchii TaxID=1381693 RepID=A0ABP0MLZ2_9DINO